MLWLCKVQTGGPVGIEGCDTLIYFGLRQCIRFTKVGLVNSWPKHAWNAYVDSKTLFDLVEMNPVDRRKTAD